MNNELNLYVIVTIYGIKIEDSEAFKSLSSQKDCNKLTITTIFYDNSEEPAEFSSDETNVLYISNPENGGLAAAYNQALSLTGDDNDWLVLLDQDSSLPDNFFSSLVSRINENRNGLVVAFAPHVLCNDLPLSPCRVFFGGRKQVVDEHYHGSSKDELFAINSGLAINSSFLRSIGGFNDAFWLDYLDHWLCRIIYREGREIYVNNIAIMHNLSVSDYNQVSVERAKNIINAEVYFYKQYKSKAEQFIYLFRILARSVKQLVKFNNKKIALNTLKGSLRLLRSQR